MNGEFRDTYLPEMLKMNDVQVLFSKQDTHVTSSKQCVRKGLKGYKYPKTRRVVKFCLLDTAQSIQSAVRTA